MGAEADRAVHKGRSPVLRLLSMSPLHRINVIRTFGISYPVAGTLEAAAIVVKAKLFTRNNVSLWWRIFYSRGPSSHEKAPFFTRTGVPVASGFSISSYNTTH